jgi:hypothetical protein
VTRHPHPLCRNPSAAGRANQVLRDGGLLFATRGTTDGRPLRARYFRVIWRVAAAVGLLALALAAPAGAASDQLVVADPHVNSLYALRGTILYHSGSFRHGRWMRVVGGVVSRARHVPVAANQTVGVDANGHVVVTMQTFGKSRTRWWSYDVARDRRRALTVPSRCGVSHVGIWRARTTFVCGGVHGQVLVRIGGRTHVVARGRFLDDDVAIGQGGKSLVDMVADDETSSVQAILNRGRRCRGIVAELPPVDARWRPLPGLWIGAHGMEWVMGDQSSLESGRFTDLAVMAVHLNGDCSAMATHWHIPTRPFPTVSAVAIDGRDVYYAARSGLYRRRLTSRAFARPPANDDIEHARALTGTLPLRAGGVVGHATLQPGEPVEPGQERTVWYSWRPSVSQRVGIGIDTGVFGAQLSVDVFTGGPGLSALRAVPISPFPMRPQNCTAPPYDVIAGQTYWITARSDAEPSYEPFTLSITRQAC